jgi:hypothetical protein
MIRAAVAFRRVAVARYDHLHCHLVGALHDGVEVVDLEPKQEAVAVGFVVAVGNVAVVVLGLEAVELKDELVIEAEAVIVWTTMVAAQVEEALVPATAGLDVRNCDEGLGAHEGSFGQGTVAEPVNAVIEHVRQDCLRVDAQVTVGCLS